MRCCLVWQEDKYGEVMFCDINVFTIATVMLIQQNGVVITNHPNVLYSRMHVIHTNKYRTMHNYDGICCKWSQ